MKRMRLHKNMTKNFGWHDFCINFAFGKGAHVTRPTEKTN